MTLEHINPEQAGAGGRGAAGDAPLRHRFAPGAPGTLYFDASSIGPMPLDAPARVQQVLEQGWRVARRRAWNETDWLQQPRSLGARIAPLLGAAPDDVAVCDSTTVNQFKLLRHALAVRAPRRVLVAEAQVFPSNRYAAEGVAQAADAELRLIQGMHDLPAALAGGDVAVVALSHVDYRSSERLDMAAITAAVHAAGACVLWDLSHSAGALAIDLRASDVDFAVGCGYKYLCGGPGAPALLYVHPRWQEGAWPAICGWMGHADTFAFEPAYRPAPGVGRHLVATPPVLANAAFGAAADLWREVDPRQLDARHAHLSDTLIALIERECAGAGLTLASPREARRRGGHVAWRFGHAAQLAQALVEAGVVVSARKPDALRFAPHPLTATDAELVDAVGRLRDILASGRWREPRFAGHSV
jgi:kynureninase